MKVGDLLTAYRRTKLYQRWGYNHDLYGRPDPLPTLPFSLVSDRVRWGPVGQYIWESRRVPGWTRHDEATTLAQESYALPDGAVVVEIGSFLGCSAVLLAGARKVRGSGRVHCIDPFDASGDRFSVPIYRAIRGSDGTSLRNRFEWYLERAGVREWVEVHAGRAEDVLPEWKEPIDLLLIDGDQSYEVVRTTYDGWSPFLKPGAVLVVHNSRPGYRRETHDGSARLVEELIRPPDYSDVRYVGSMTFARKLRGRAAQSRAGGSTRMKVSVSLITYDHERFIAEAIESVLSQKADFEWELVVGDDCSTDRTGEIVGEFAERYPGRIRVLPSERNFGLVGNFVRTFRACQGEYVALLDGDDYWTNPLKLQRQAEFLDSHPECSICFHDAAVLLPDDTVCATNYTAADQKEISSVEDLFATNFIATCSAMLRRGAVPELPSWYAGCLWEDWPLYILYAERGKIGYLNEVMAVYRNHGRGLWSGLDSVEQLEAVIRFLLDMDDHLGHRYRAAIESSVSKYRNRLVVAERDQMIRDLQAELHAKLGEANRVIRDLQGELHAKVGECNRIIQDLQARLQGTEPAAGSGGSASAREGGS